MFPNYCRCCSNKTGILLPLKSQSSHMDGKTLLDYFNYVLDSFVQDRDTSDNICLRCSKALQVAYHFISMVKDTERSVKSDENNNEESTFLGNPMIPEKENEDNPKKQVVPVKLPNSCKIFVQDLYQDAATFLERKQLKTELKCVICNKLFKDKNQLYDHNAEKHKEIVPNKCELCSFYTCYTQSLWKHYKKAHALNNVELNLYETKKVSNNSMKNPNFETTYKCLQCDFKSGSQTDIDDHLLKTHSIEEDKESYQNKFFNCPSCHRCYNDLKSAKIHYSMYHNCSFKRNNIFGNKIYACEKCGKLFDLRSGLFLHRRVCEKQDAVNCNFCHLQFTSILKYEQHLQARHWVAIKHECEICGKTFSCPAYLTVHRKRHNERYYQCDMCTKNYISNAELKVHKQRTHANKKLKNHESEDSTSRHFKCTYCDFVSHSSFTLKVHQYNHTGKPYKCQLCPKEFAFRKALRQHCERHHSISITNEEMAEMFRKTYGYISRFDAFSNKNNSLEISEINDLELEVELEEFGLTIQDIMVDLFEGEMPNNNNNNTLS